jgi:Protein of unknown function (DUF2868)
LLVQAFDTGPADNPLWTAEDRVWATRLARETTPANASNERYLQARAHHALQRIGPRDKSSQRWLNSSLWRSGWLMWALLIGAAAGLLVDAIGSSQRINLLAPPVWAVILWNGLVYLGLLLGAAFALTGPTAQASPARGPRAWLARAAQVGAGGVGVLPNAASAWARLSAALAWARAGVLLHTAAAALALGLIAGLYVRGLVLDYRAAWQSTFLDAPTVHGVLSFLLAPAVAFTGIGVPDAATLQALRLGPDQPATASAAPWIHLYATTLMLFVLLPRSLLAIVAAAQAWRGAHQVALPLQEPYFQRLLHERRLQAANVQVVPHGAPPSAQATLSLREWLLAALGPGLQLNVAAATAYGDEDGAVAPLGATTLRIMLVELSSTPEADSHGRLLQTLRTAAPALPLLLLADEAAFAQRFAHLPARLAERRAAWSAFAKSHNTACLFVDLSRPNVADAPAAWAAAH